MITEITDILNNRCAGTIFFDGACRICVGGVRRFGPMLRARGFELRPLQSPDAARLLELPQDQLLDEVRVLTTENRVLAGADAILHISRHIWWAWPVWLLAFIPGVRPILRMLYRRVVPYRYCIAGRCDAPARLPRIRHAILAWMPGILLPVSVVLVARHLPPWALMWLMAAAIFYGCKWLTWRTASPQLRSSCLRSLAYLLLWPGMDARQFLDPTAAVDRPDLREWVGAIAKMTLGAALVWIVARFCVLHQPLLAGSIGLIGLTLLLHFGLFDLLSVMWRSAGFDAQPIMDRPLLSTSVADFWGRRWNRAFSLLSDRFIFGPARAWLGGAGALMLCFAISGLVHELVITLPARCDWGGPTIYFLIQGLAILLERTKLARRAGLGRSWTGRSFAALVTIAPLPLLFPVPFIERVILPFMDTIGARGAIHLSAPALPTMIFLAGLLHFGVLLASALVPRVLDWKAELSKLQPLLRHLIWVHGAYIVLIIIAFGVISTANVRELASGTLLARSMCGFIAIFWLIRLILQFALFDAQPYLTSSLLKLGYHGLTVVFTILVLTCGLAAVVP